MAFLFKALVCFVLMGGTASSYELPALGDASSAIVSQQQELEMGSAWVALLRNEVPLVKDPLIKSFVESSVYKLAETSQVNDRQFTFVVINSKELNAFAAPGGIIGINAGLFLYAETEGEYASVMTHELAHLSQRHFARNVQTQQNMQLPFMAAMLAGVVATAMGAGDAGLAALTSTQAAADQMARGYSRANEQEADRIGLTNLQRAGYNPSSMPAMFWRLQKQYQYESKPSEFLSTHPLSESRIADTQNRVAQLPNKGTTDSLKYQLMRKRIEVMFEAGMGNAYERFKAQLDADPKSLAAKYGAAIAQAKMGQMNEARRLLRELIQQDPLELSYQVSLINTETKANQWDVALKLASELYARHPNNYPVQQARIDVLDRLQRYQDVDKALEKLVKERPKDPDVWYQVAEVRGQNSDIVGVHQARAEYFALMGDYKQALAQLKLARQKVTNNYPLSASIDMREQVLKQEEKDVQELMH